MKRKVTPIFLVASTIALGIVLVVVSLHANRLREERETALAAARHDGAALLALVSHPPSIAAGMMEIESGPLRSDLTTAKEAWAAWRQDFTTDQDYSQVVSWHEEQLGPTHWKKTASSPNKTTFAKGEWSLSLTILPENSRLRFRRELLWQREIP